MIVSKLVIKHLFSNFILNTHVAAVYFRKKWINWRHGVDVSEDVTTTKAMRRLNDKIFWCFDTAMSTSDS